jgi:hypothetical protein
MTVALGPHSNQRSVPVPQHARYVTSFPPLWHLSAILDFIILLMRSHYLRPDDPCLLRILAGNQIGSPQRALIRMLPRWDSSSCRVWERTSDNIQPFAVRELFTAHMLCRRHWRSLRSPYLDSIISHEAVPCSYASVSLQRSVTIWDWYQWGNFTNALKDYLSFYSTSCMGGGNGPGAGCRIISTKTLREVSQCITKHLTSMTEVSCRNCIVHLSDAWVTSQACDRFHE